MPQEITLVTISQQMSGLSQQIGKIDGRLTKLESLSQQFVERFDQIDARFEQIDVRFDQADARFDQVDARFTKVESRLDRVEQKLDSTFDAVGELKVQVTSIDDRLLATQNQLHDFQAVIAAKNMKHDLEIQGHERRLTVLER
jgi:chromosome segregation ATPase